MNDNQQEIINKLKELKIFANRADIRKTCIGCVGYNEEKLVERCNNCIVAHIYFKSVFSLLEHSCK